MTTKLTRDDLAPRYLMVQGDKHFCAVTYNPRDYAQALYAATRWKAAGFLSNAEYDDLGQTILKSACMRSDCWKCLVRWRSSPAPSRRIQVALERSEMPFIDYKPDHRRERCNSPEHNPPAHIVLKPGWHTWQCPSCGHKQRFHVDGYSSILAHPVGGK